jgi:hypothetical protein
VEKHCAGVALLVVLGALCACGGDSLTTEPGGPDRVVPLGREYELRVGEKVRLADSPRVDVLLVRVFSDSRCPIDVQCPTAGTVDLELEASQPQAAQSDVIRFTGTGGPQDRATLLGYRFAVQRVLPARMSGRNIPTSAYRVVLISSVDR